MSTRSKRDPARLLRQVATQKLPRVTRAVAAGALSGTVVPVYLDGDDSAALPARYIGGPQPVAGDPVWVYRFRRTLLVLGDPRSVLPFRVAHGHGTVTMTSGAASGTVTYPPGRFTVAPFALVWSAGGTPIHGQASAYNGTTGFDFSLTQIGGTSFSGAREFNWLAIQMLSNAAAG